MRRKTTLVLVLAAGCLAAAPLAANPPAWSVPDGDSAASGQARMAFAAARLHGELGRFYMMAGDFEAARDHFVAITEIEMPERSGERARRQRRSGPGPAHAYLMAAVTSQLAGDVEGAILLAEAGRALAEQAPPADASDSEGLEADRPERRERGEHGRRGGRHGHRGRGPGLPFDASSLTEAFDRFLEDPEGAAAHFAGGVDEMEERLLEIEARLSENGE